VQTGGTRQADFGRAGYFYHAPSGLYLTRHRAYSPVFAQFLSRDRLGEHGGFYNLYNYASNNGANRVDPSGLFDLRGTNRAGIIVNRSNEPILAFDNFDPDYRDSGQAYIVPPGCTTTNWRDLDYMMGMPPVIYDVNYRFRNPVTGLQDVWYHVRPQIFFGSIVQPGGMINLLSVGRGARPGHVPRTSAEHHMLFDGTTDRWIRERGYQCAACEGGPPPVRR
jgi:RHS repeat-associated protein